MDMDPYAAIRNNPRRNSNDFSSLFHPCPKGQALASIAPYRVQIFTRSYSSPFPVVSMPSFSGSSQSSVNKDTADEKEDVCCQHALEIHCMEEDCSQSFDLEPLPLLSPTCYDTLRAVNPHVFESHAEDDVEEAPEPTPFAKNESPFLPTRIRDTEATPQGGDKEEQLPVSKETFFEKTRLHASSTYDVVCSRAKQYYESPGCQRFRQIVRAAVPAYMRACTRLDKSSVIESTIDEAIHHPKVGRIRFWKYDNVSGTWNVLNNDQIRDKVGHALREMAQERNRAQRQEMFTK